MLYQYKYDIFYKGEFNDYEGFFYIWFILNEMKCLNIIFLKLDNC